MNKKIESAQQDKEKLDQRLLELSALFEISRSLASSLSIRAILENILRIPMGHLLISRGIVLLSTGGESEYEVEEVKGISRNLREKTLRIEEPPEYASLVTEIDTSHEWVEFFSQFGIEIVLPLNTSQGIIGIVGYGKKIGDEPFTEREIEFLDSLSNIAATAVANGLNVEEIRKVNRSLDRKIQQLNTIFDISQELNTTLDRYKIGSIAAFAVMGELMVNKCAVFFHDGPGGMTLLVSKGLDGEALTLPRGINISEPLLLENSRQCSELAEHGLALLVPMRMQDEIKGILAIGGKITKKDFDEADIEFLKTLGNQTASTLENTRLFEEALEKQRMEEELSIARSMQQGLLPSALPAAPECEFAALNIPSRQVGGDYYDVIPVADGVYGVTIADVSGKGAGAALLMANLQAGLKVLVPAGEELPSMVSKINTLIHANTAMDKFITFFYATIDVTADTLTYCNAGHNPPYLVHSSGRVEELMTGGIVIGMMDEVMFGSETVDFRPGDRVALYTDGITEAMNAEGEEFGEERLIEILKKNPQDSSAQMLQRIVEAVQNWQPRGIQADDITLVIATRKKT